MNFHPRSVFIHVAKEPYENGEERGVYVHLGGDVKKSLYLAGRNSTPEAAPYRAKPLSPFGALGSGGPNFRARANRYAGDGKLTVEFKQEVITEPSPRGTTFEFVLHPTTKDLFVIKKNNTSTRSTEVHVLSASSNYQDFVRHSGTALHETDARYQFLLDKGPNLLAIKKHNTDTNKTEVHRLSEKSQYQTFDLHTPTALFETSDAIEFLPDRKSGLCAIEKRNTGSDYVEFRRISGRKFDQLGPEIRTVLPASNAEFDVRLARVLLSEETDLIALRTPRARSSEIAIMVASAKSKYKALSLGIGLPLNSRGVALAFLQDADNDLYVIMSAGGDSARMYIFSARSLYQKSSFRPIKLPRELVTSTSVMPDILSQEGRFMLLPCNNEIVLGAPESDSLTAENAGAVAAAVGSGLSEMAELVKPVFYMDNRHTLFVEPNVTETTIEDHEEWVQRTLLPATAAEWINRLNDVVVMPASPGFKLSGPVWAERDGRLPIDSPSLIKATPDMDWLINPVTGLVFDGVVVGPGGRTGFEVRPAGEMIDSVIRAGVPVSVHAGSGVAADTGAVLTGAAAIGHMGLSPVSGSLNIVGSAGFNAGLAQNVARAGRLGIGAGRPAAGTTER